MEKHMSGYSGTPLSHSPIKFMPSVFIRCIERSCRSRFSRRTSKCYDRNNVSACSIFRIYRHTAFLSINTDLIAGLFTDNTSDIRLQLAVHIVKLITTFIKPSVLSFFETLFCTSRCCKSFWNNFDLERFHTPAQLRRPGRRTIGCPSHPSKILYMTSVVNIKVIRCFTGQFNLNGLDTFAFSLRTCVLTFLSPILPRCCKGWHRCIACPSAR